MPSVRLTGEYNTHHIGVGGSFPDTIEFLADTIDMGCWLRFEVAPDTVGDKEKQYAVLWARDLPVPKATFARWLQEELAKLKRANKRGENCAAYRKALQLGLYTRESCLGKTLRFRYLRPEDLEVPPQPYPEKGSWNPKEWVPYNSDFLVELAEYQQLDPKYRWLAPALRRAGNRVRWNCGCSAFFVSNEEWNVLDAEPRRAKNPYPPSVVLIHPTEGSINIRVLPKGRIRSLEFDDHAIECLSVCEELS